MLVLHPTVAAIRPLRFWMNMGYNYEPLRPSPTPSAISTLWGGVSHSGYDGHRFYPHLPYACFFPDYVNAEKARNGVGPPDYETACGRWRLDLMIKGHIRTVSSALDKTSSVLHHDLTLGSVSIVPDSWLYSAQQRRLTLATRATCTTFTLNVSLVQGIARSSILDQYDQWRPTPSEHVDTASATLSATLSSTLDRYPAVSSSVDKSAALVKSIRPAVYQTSCVQRQPDSELQKGARVISTLLFRTLGDHPSVSSAIGKYASAVDAYAVRAHDAACRALRPQPVPLIGFLRHDMSVPSTLGSCGRGTESLYPMPPRATPIPVFWKVVSAPRVVIICCCFILLALTTLRGYAKQLYLDAGIYLSPVCRVHTTALADSQPLPGRAPTRPSPTPNTGRRDEPPIVWKRKWIRKID